MGEHQLGATAVGLAAAALGLFVWWLTRLAAVGRLRKNMWAGIRTRRTMQSDQTWVRGHRAALSSTRRTAIATVLLGLVCVLLALAGHWVQGLVAGFGALGVVLVGALLAVRDAHQALDNPGH